MPLVSTMEQARPSSFALYRIPSEAPCIIAPEDTDVHFFSEMPSLSHREGFVFAPFYISQETPFVLFDKTCTPQSWNEQKAHRLYQNALPYLTEFSHSVTSQEDYTCAFSLFNKHLAEQKVEKLVLSRCQDFSLLQTFDAISFFLTACQRYPHAFVSLVFTPTTGMWLGCSPEILLAGEDKKWKTTALAGTILVDRQGKCPQWDEKNHAEQGVVAEYICNALSNAGICPALRGPYTFFAGNVAHLRTDFFFTLPDNTSLDTLLATLHPTPAVCGSPQKEALAFILEHEKTFREYYSGYLGPIGKKTAMYVNLRCMQIGNTSLRLFAGGGIMPQSDMAGEWQETEQKMRTLLDVLK